MKSFFTHLVIIASILLLASCAAPINKRALTPTQVTSYESTGETITILPVKIMSQPKLSLTDIIHSMPEPDTYRDVIADTVRNIGLFSEVKKNGDSDYALSSVVIGERYIGSVNNIGMFLIHYELNDMRTGSTIWSENIFSYSMLSAEDVFMGHERAPKVIEAGIRDNMTQLATKIGVVLPKPSN